MLYRFCGWRTGKTIVWGFAVFAAAGASLQTVQAQQLQPLTITPSVSVSETFTDNEDLDPDGEKDPALITTVSPAISATADLRSVTANVAGNLDFRYQTLNDEGFDLGGALSGFANVTWVEDLFFTDFRASVSQELLDSQDARSASDDNTQNLDTVQNYQISPYLTNRFGDYANSQLRYQGSYTDSSSSDLNTAFGNLATWDVSSGTEFTSLLWTTLAQYGYLYRPDEEDVSSHSGELDLRYVFDPTFSVLGNAGYQWFDDNEDEDFAEPIWEVGFVLTPSPRLELGYLYGKRNDSKNHTANLRYDITATTQLNASYFETLETGQGRLNRNLSSLGSDPNGNQINTNTNQSFNSNPSSTSVNDETTRTKTATLNLDSIFGRNTVGINGTFEDRNDQNSADDEQAWIAGVRFSRQLTQSLSGEVGGSYEFRNFDSDADTDTYVGTLSISYALTQSISTSASYSYQKRTSSDPDEEFTENTATVSVGIAF